jgi:hypothetical protein
LICSELEKIGRGEDEEEEEVFDEDQIFLNKKKIKYGAISASFIDFKS